MLSLLPVSWTRIIDPGLTVIGAAFYLGYGIRLWRNRPWWLKVTYLTGGAVLALYEVHMVWWIEAMGLALILATVVGGSERRDTAAEPVPGKPGPSGS
ncbi:MAG: hypothetical protein ACP5QO_10400 [Clostridia bacterium]